MEINLTVEEIVQMLKRSSLTTIVVEGKDDMTIYRWIEDEIGISKANFLPCGGREILLKVFERRHEFSHIKTIFVADKDGFVYDCVPAKYSDVLWTKGYSIENDLYCGKFVEKLLTVTEEVNFRISIRNFIKYYAFEVEQYNKKLIYNFSNHPQQVLTDNHELNEAFLESVNFIEPKSETIEYLQEQYDLLIRGKSLFALLLRFLCHKRREVRHKKNILFEACFKLSGNGYVHGLILEMKRRLELV
jgi:hypothetical protein